MRKIPEFYPKKQGRPQGSRPLDLEGGRTSSEHNTAILRVLHDALEVSLQQAIDDHNEDLYYRDLMIKAILSVILGADWTEVDFEDIDWQEIAASEIDLASEAEQILDLLRGILKASDVELSEIGTATYDDLQDLINNTQSAGYVSGGLITDATGGLINVSAMEGFLKTTDSAIGETKSFSLATQYGLDILTDARINYVYVDYNNGSPRILATVTRSDIELNRQFTLGRVYRDGTTLHIMQSGVQLANFFRKEHERLYGVRYVERATGLLVTDDEDRSFDVSAGTFYAGQNKITVASALDTSADYFTYWSYIDGAWAKTAHDQTQISDRQYNDMSSEGSEALANLTANRYGVHWIFIDLDGHIHVLYGQGDYKLTEAQDASLPATLPEFLADYSLLICRIIKKEQVDAFTEIASAFVRFFPTILITDHGEIGGLLDDDHTQYVLHSLADAANDFLVASEADTYIKKTLAETLTILAHTIASHSDTTATGAELEELTDGSETDLHSHAADGAGATIVRKTADQTVNNSTDLVNDDHLLLAMGANEVWYLEAVLIGNPAAAADIKFTFTVPVGASTYHWWIANQIADLTGESQLTTNAFAVTDFIEGLGIDRIYLLYAFVINGGNAGNIQLQWAQNAAHASDTKIKTNSFLRATQIL